MTLRVRIIGPQPRSARLEPHPPEEEGRIYPRLGREYGHAHTLPFILDFGPQELRNTE